jgi:hypothetical protein
MIENAGHGGRPAVTMKVDCADEKIGDICRA